MCISWYLRTGAVQEMPRVTVILNGHGQQAIEMIHSKNIRDQDTALVLLLIQHPIPFGECLVRCGEIKCHNTFSSYKFGDFINSRRPHDNSKTTNVTIPVVVVSVVVLLLIIFGLIIWRYRRHKLKKHMNDRMTKVLNSVTAFISPLYSYILWNPRAGEPRWAESSHMITKIILFCVFCAYLTYNINQVVTSPTSILSIKQQNDTVPTPDVRLCVRGLVAPNVSCTKADVRGCPNEEPVQFTNSRIYPNSTYKPSRLGTECWYSQGGGMLEYDDTLQFQLQYEIDDAAEDHSLQIEVYPQRSANPNIYLYYTPEQQNDYFLPNILDSTPPDQQSLISWAMQDVQYDGPTLNRYTIDLTMQNRPVIAYQHETHRSLSSSPWNVFGFASSYDENLEITTTFQTSSIKPRINNTAGDVSYSTIILWPSQMADVTLQEQRVYPLVSVLGSVGGLLALLITINGFLYGTRPNSPWGAVHNFFGFKTSLQQNLYNKFGFMGRPIPLVHPVDPLLYDNNKKHYKDLIQKYPYFPGMVEQQNLETIHSSETKSSSTTAIHQPDYVDDIYTAKNMAPESSSSSTTSDNNADSHQLELELVKVRLESYAQSHKELQQRIQFLEVMLKSYYINDEVMKGLNSAYENEKVKKLIMDDDDHNDMTIDMYPFRLRNSTIRSRFAPDLQSSFYRHRQEENNDGNHRSKTNTSSGGTVTASSNDDRSEDSPFIKDQ
ncbi:hypothetical protein BDC45DRAFT_123016 [Circinella umbellata]|nr:hypothetical protein BDC45DRAFT_123016 [Circinella umbellata]